jgi:hypothetical protein
VLRKTGLVVLERQGRFRLYRTEPACVLAIAGSLEQLVSPRGEGIEPSQPGAARPDRL